MPQDVRKIKIDLIEAGKAAAEDLISVAKQKIVTTDKDPLAADKLKNAAAAKKMAIFDAFDILARIQIEEDNLKDEDENSKTQGKNKKEIKNKNVDFGTPEQRQG